MTTDRDIIVIGAGGHAKVVLNALLNNGFRVRGLVDHDVTLHGQSVLGCPILGDDSVLEACDPRQTVLANGIGMPRDSRLRRTIFERLRQHGFSFPVLVDASAILGDEVTLGEGAQILAGAVIQPGTAIGDNTIINSRATVDHDCVIGAHAHIAPGATLCGGVILGEGCLVGAGAILLPGIRIGDATIIGAGCTVRHPIASNTIFLGHRS